MSSIPGSRRSPGGMATHSSVYAWRIPQTEESGYSPQGHKESNTTDMTQHGKHTLKTIKGKMEPVKDISASWSTQPASSARTLTFITISRLINTFLLQSNHPINIRFISGLFRNVIKTVQFFYFDFFCSTLYLWDASILVFMQLQFISFHCFMNKLYIIALSIVRIYHISFIYSAVNGYWRCFKTLAIINNAAMNMFSGEQIHAFLLDQQEQNC